MTLFHSPHDDHSPEQRRFYALVEVGYTVVDFTAGMMFVVGSVMFFFESLMTAGTWLFLIGSICFAMKPVIRLWREIKLLRMGDYDDIAAKNS